MKHEKLTRAEAFALGRKHFYSGKACKYGHDALRFTSTGGCMACNAARSKVFARATTGGGKVFSYALHADDVAAALAYCQALDLQRGRVPFVPDAVPRGAEVVAVPAEIEQRRQDLLKHYATPPAAPAYLPKP